MAGYGVGGPLTISRSPQLPKGLRVPSRPSDCPVGLIWKMESPQAVGTPPLVPGLAALPQSSLADRAGRGELPYSAAQVAAIDARPAPSSTSALTMESRILSLKHLPSLLVSLQQADFLKVSLHEWR